MLEKIAFRIMTVGCVLLLASCGRSEEASKKDSRSLTEAQANLSAELELFSDPTRAAAEIQRRVQDAVRVENDFIVVKGGLGYETFVFPMRSPWYAKCGLFGLTLQFGNGVEGSGDNIRNAAEIFVAPNIPEDKCTSLAIVAGKEVEAILESSSR